MKLQVDATRRAALRAVAAQLLELAGLAALTYGAWLIYPAAGYVAGGILAVLAGIAMERLR